MMCDRDNVCIHEWNSIKAIIPVRVQGEIKIKVVVEYRTLVC